MRIETAPCLLAAAAFVGGMVAAAPARAASASATMEVSLTVEAACRIDAGGLAFGTIDQSGARTDSEAVLDLRCTPGAPFSVTLDEGRNGGGGTRRMADASGMRSVAYDIYRDPARAQRWDAASPSTGIAPADGRMSLIAYGRVAGGSAPAAARYADTVTVSVDF